MGSQAVAPELRYSMWTVLVLGVTTTMIPGGRVLVLPEIFVLMLLLLYWAAKPRAKE